MTRRKVLISLYFDLTIILYYSFPKLRPSHSVYDLLITEHETKIGFVQCSFCVFSQIWFFCLSVCLFVLFISFCICVRMRIIFFPFRFHIAFSCSAIIDNGIRNIRSTCLCTLVNSSHIS